MRDRKLKGGAERQERESETGRLWGIKPHENRAFVEGGLKIMSSFVTQSERRRRNVFKNASVHINQEEQPAMLFTVAYCMGGRHIIHLDWLKGMK